VTAVNDLLKPTIEGHGGLPCWEQVSRFRRTTASRPTTSTTPGCCAAWTTSWTSRRGPSVHYPSEYRDFDGIMVPTRRRVYVRNPDGSPALRSVSILIDIADATFI
jgi:hypothetical protein